MRLCSTSSVARRSSSSAGISDEQRNGVLVELQPARRIEVAEEADAIRIPAPPDVVGQRPEAFLRGGDEAVEGARFADDRRDLVGRFDQHADLIVAKGARFLGLHDQHALQDAAIDDRARRGRNGIPLLPDP